MKNSLGFAACLSKNGQLMEINVQKIFLEPQRVSKVFNINHH